MIEAISWPCWRLLFDAHDITRATKTKLPIRLAHPCDAVYFQTVFNFQSFSDACCFSSPSPSYHALSTAYPVSLALFS